MVSTALTLFDDDDADDARVINVELVDDTATAVAVLEARAQEYARKSKADNTWRAYSSDVRQFAAWCARNRRIAMPAEPETVRDYLIDHASSLTMSTLRRRLAAISQAHAFAGETNPTKVTDRQGGGGRNAPCARSPAESEGSSRYRRDRDAGCAARELV